MASNTIRFTGLSSGMDTEALVKAMLLTQQNKINKQTKQQQLYNWKQEAWKEMNGKINSFNEKYIDKLKLQTTFVKNKITTSNDNAISISENSNIASGIHKVQIKQLATSAYMVTKGATASVKPIDVSTKLSDLGINEVTKLRIESKDPQSVKEVEVNPNSSLADLKDTLNAEGIELSISNNQLKLKSNSTSNLEIKVIDNDTDSNPDTWSGDKDLLSKLGLGSSNTVTLESEKEVQGSQLRKDKLDGSTTLGNLTSEGNLLFTSDQIIEVNGKEVTLKTTDTINDMIRKMKSADSNLSINYDGKNQQFFVNSTITGANSQTKITGTDEASNKLLGALGLVQQGTVDTTSGKNALYTYNGMGNKPDSTDPSKLYFESESNTVNINGIEMTFKATTSEAISIQGTPNTDGIVSFMKEFVSEYNKLIEDINTKLTTKTKSEYEPLTDEEKESTSEANAEKIEKYIKEGLFYRSSELRQVSESMRNIFAGIVKGNEKYKTLDSVGITTGNWRENGKLYFDEESFKKAMEDKPDEVMKLFTGGGDTSIALEEYMKKNNITDSNKAAEEYNRLTSNEKQQYMSSSQGIFYKISDNFKTLSKSSDFRSFGSYYNDKLMTEELKTTAEKIYTLNQQYSAKETALYKKFTAMEKAMSQLNSQQSYLTSMLGQ